MNATRAIPSGALALALACAPAATSNRTSPTTERLVRTAGSYETLIETNRREVVFVDSVALHPARAWAELPAVFSEMELPVSAADAARLELATVAHQPRRIEGGRLSDYLDCGRNPTGGAYADSYLVRLWVSARVVPDGERSKVETAVRATAQPRGLASDPLPCVSRGVIERRMVERLRDRVAAGRDG